MTVLKPRSRSITIRLSEEEFEALSKYCRTAGARSLSDLAREVMGSVLHRAGGNGTGGRVEDFQRQLDALGRRIEELAGAMVKPGMGEQG